MPEVVAELFELVEDDDVVPSLPGQLVTLVEDLLDIAFASRSGDHFAGDSLEPLEPFLAHALREDCNGLTAEHRGVERAAPGIVARGRPRGLLLRGVEGAGDERRSKAPVGCPHLVRPGGEPLSDQRDDPRRDSRKGRGELEEVHVAEKPARLHGLIPPRDAKEVQRVHVPEPRLFQAFPDLRGGLFGGFHLGKGGKNDAFLFAAADVARARVGMLLQCDHGTMKTAPAPDVKVSGVSSINSARPRILRRNTPHRIAVLYISAVSRVLLRGIPGSDSRPPFPRRALPCPAVRPLTLPPRRCRRLRSCA